MTMTIFLLLLAILPALANQRPETDKSWERLGSATQSDYSLVDATHTNCGKTEQVRLAGYRKDVRVSDPEDDLNQSLHICDNPSA